MESSGPAINTFYGKYNNGGVMSAAMPAISLMVIINSIGILANILTIVITIKSKDQDFNETQKKVKCKVMINYKDIREMTINELTEYMEDLEEKKYASDDIPVFFGYEKVTEEPKSIINNDNKEFVTFLSYLYCIFHKIEVKMERAGYPNILRYTDFGSEETSPRKVFYNLQAAKREFTSMNKDDFLNTYPIFKKLFFHYLDYIRCWIEQKKDMDERSRLPTTIEEMKPFLKELNTWMPVKIRDKWVNYSGSFIGTPAGYEKVIKTLIETPMFSDYLVIDDEKAKEPYIEKQYNKKILFGFVNMKGAEEMSIPYDTALFEAECPEKCTEDLRVWICTKCGKNLRSTANYLLAMQCFFDSLHVLAHFYLAYILYSGKNFNSLPTCYHVMIGPLTGLNFGMGLIFFTAFDRLVSMILPIRHQRINKLLYLGTMIAICLLYNIYILYIGYVNAQENKDTMVVCLIIEGIHGPPTATWSITAAVLVFGAVFIYIVIGICLRYKVESTTTTKKLYKSLLILCIIMMCSWVMTSISLILCGALQLSEELSFFIPLYTGITINIACASNFFVLSRYSSEYRTATKEFFSKFGFTNFFSPVTVNTRIFDKSSVHKPTVSLNQKE